MPNCTDGGPGREEPIIVVYWVTNGINACHIGFLPRHMNHHAARYDGVLGQITDTFSAGHRNHIVCEKWHRNMEFCHAAVISPLNGDAMVVEVTGGVAVLGEVPAGMAAAEAAKKFCLGGPLPCGIHSLYFRHWRPMNVSPFLRNGVFVELITVSDTDNGVNCDATWSREAAVLAILDASYSEPIAATIPCHPVWKTKKNAASERKIWMNHLHCCCILKCCHVLGLLGLGGLLHHECLDCGWNLCLADCDQKMCQWADCDQKMWH